LVPLDKLHKTLVANVDEVNGQQNISPSDTIICHSYITIQINNLHNDMGWVKKVEKNVSKIDGGSSSSIFNGFRLWHMA
jgi:hypothetical protein